ncbi:MAG: NAD(P)H-dependent oxidoreductase [Clostridiaceae bacterium]|nr:NAD(P)H-dependent oxidoreductase [Clostridiaceae bacterium]
MKKILMVVGSMRNGSFNQQVAKHIAKLLKNKAEVAFLDYKDLPFMNQDIEYPTPEAVKHVRSEVDSADGLWIVSPEYNHSIPAVLKNFLDWISRPNEANNPKAGKASADKKVTFSGIGGSNETAGCRNDLFNLCKFIGMNIVGDRGTGLQFNRETFATGKVTFSEEDNAKLLAQVDAFLAYL